MITRRSLLADIVPTDTVPPDMLKPDMLKPDMLKPDMLKPDMLPTGTPNPTARATRRAAPPRLAAHTQSAKPSPRPPSSNPVHP